jgi:hypothetical protein
MSVSSCIHCRPDRPDPFARQTVSGHGSNAFPGTAPRREHHLGWVIRILESSSQSWLVSKRFLWNPIACPMDLGGQTIGRVVLQSSLKHSGSHQPPSRNRPQLHSVDTCTPRRTTGMKGREGEVTGGRSRSCDWADSRPSWSTISGSGIQREADGYSLVYFGIPGR